MHIILRGIFLANYLYKKIQSSIIRRTKHDGRRKEGEKNVRANGEKN